MSAGEPRRLLGAAVVGAIALGLSLAANTVPTVAAERADGPVVYSWFSLTESELGPPFTSRTESAIQAVGPRGGTPTTLRGCTRATGQPDAGDCTIAYGSPSVSPSGRQVAFDAGRTLALMRIDGSGFRLLPSHSRDDGQPAFSPTGRRLAFSAGPIPSVHHPLARGVRTSDLDGTGTGRVTDRGTAPAWSARNWIAFLRADGIYRVRPDGDGLRRLVERRSCTDVAWSPAGTRLAFTCRDRLLLSDGAGRHVRSVPAGAAEVVPFVEAGSVAWAPSGRRLAVATFGGHVITLRLDGTGQRALVSGGTGATYNLGAGSVDWGPLP